MIVVFVVTQPHISIQLFFSLLHEHAYNNGNNYKESVTQKNLENLGYSVNFSFVLKNQETLREFYRDSENCFFKDFIFSCLRVSYS